MNHDEATLYFDSLGAGTDSGPPLAELVSAGRTAERRRRRRTISASVAAVALILGGGAVVQRAVPGGDSPQKPDQVAEPLPAPGGMRYVAMKRIAVAVPESWGTQDTRCGQPVSATVYFTESAHRSCRVEPEEPVPTLHFIDGDSEEGQLLASGVREGTTRNGVAVFEGPSCPDTGYCAQTPYVVDTASKGVVIALEGPAAEEPLRSQILGTLQLLPDEYVAVPHIDPGTRITKATRRLDDAGLGIQTIVGNGVDGPTFGTDPAAGTVVPRGSTVALLLEPGGPLLTDFQIETARRIVEAKLEENPEWEDVSAWARWTTGAVDQPNVGECKSGELLKISMFGRFPDIVTSGSPPQVDGTPAADPDPLAGVVTEVMLTADAQTEEVCLLGVGTGTRKPDPRATQIYGEAEPESTDIPDPQAGTRLAGLGRVVVSVPADWGNVHECASDVIAPPTGCQQGEDAIGSIRFYDIAFEGAADINGPSEQTYNGVDVVEGELDCPDTASCVAPMRYAVEVPDQGIGFITGGPGMDLQQMYAIIESLQLLPEGQTTVPYIGQGTWNTDAAFRLTSVGLQPAVSASTANGRRPVESVSPAPGTVIAEGSTVTLQLWPDRDARESLAVGEAGEVEAYTHCGLNFVTIDGDSWVTGQRRNGTYLSISTFVARTAEDRVRMYYPTWEDPAIFRPAGPQETPPPCF